VLNLEKLWDLYFASINFRVSQKSVNKGVFNFSVGLVKTNYKELTNKKFGDCTKEVLVDYQAEYNRE